MPHRVCHNESLDIKLIVLPDRKKVSDDSEIASAITTEVCISHTSFNFVKDLTDARIIGGVLHGEVSQHKATFDHKLLNLSVTDFFFSIEVCISRTSFNFVKDLADARIIGGVLHGEVSRQKATFDHKLLNLSVTDFFFLIEVCISRTSFNFVKDSADARIIGGVLHGEVSRQKATFDHKLLNLSVTDGEQTL